MSAPATPVMSAPEVSAYIDEVFPQIKANGDDISVEAVSFPERRWCGFMPTTSICAPAVP
jgi:hypothetical protein